MNIKETFLLCLICLLCPDPIRGHGYLIDPLSRSATMHPKYLTDEHTCDNGQTNWTPQGSFCGGRQTQENNGGNCSACGDNYAISYPRPHDFGGIYATGITPTRVYLKGQVITVIVRMTASHLGNFTFKLCNKLETDYPNQDVLADCFNDTTKHIVLRDENDNTHFGGINRTGNFTYDLVLPSNVTCPEGCSLQWWYVTGNSPNLFPEHFVNCADIRIVDCDQYLDEDIDTTWCALGPTTELIEWCDETSEESTSESSSSEESSNEESSSEDSSNDESSNQEGSTDGNSGEESTNGQTSENEDQTGSTEDENNNEGNDNTEENSGDTDSENQGNDESNEEEAESGTSSQSSGNCTGNSGESSSEDNSGSGTPSCNSCTNAQSPTCNNNCCSQSVREVYVSTITNAPDMWCDVHCTSDPPFCPSIWCCKKEAVHWVNVCSTKKSLTSLVDLLEKKVKEIKKKSTKSQS